MVLLTYVGHVNLALKHINWDSFISSLPAGVFMARTVIVVGSLLQNFMGITGIDCISCSRRALVLVSSFFKMVTLERHFITSVQIVKKFGRVTETAKTK